MARNPLHDLEDCGVSVWNDNIRRSWVADGGLKRLIEDDGITGVTSNPTIFEKAIDGSQDYDGDLHRLSHDSKSPEDVFKSLAITDISMAADVLRPVYDRTEGRDGYVSIEVSPDAAHDKQKTLDDAHYFWKTINRPNIMIKVPATEEGIPAVEQLISEGINVNITLIFAVEVYEKVMEAYIHGLERRAEAGQPIDRVGSVASFFVSRVDSLVDKLLEEKAGSGEAQRAKDLEGKAAVANAKIAYERFQQIFGGDRFKRLQEKNARVQRPLWASTSTKNPSYPDTLYVTSLVGKDIVNTMPPQTIDAVRDHGQIECGTITQDVTGAHRVVEDLKSVGIDMKAVTDQLTVEGVDSFCKSLHQLYDAIAQKSDLILAR